MHVNPGYTIPAGWMVMMSPMAVHLNPEFFEDPLDFNPWRWLVSEKLKPNYCYPFLSPF